jgi:hypothetical protein
VSVVAVVGAELLKRARRVRRRSKRWLGMVDSWSPAAAPAGMAGGGGASRRRGYGGRGEETLTPGPSPTRTHARPPGRGEEGRRLPGPCFACARGEDEDGKGLKGLGAQTRHGPKQVGRQASFDVDIAEVIRIIKLGGSARGKANCWSQSGGNHMRKLFGLVLGLSLVVLGMSKPVSAGCRNFCAEQFQSCGMSDECETAYNACMCGCGLC